jgi:hypothetical protein
VRSPVGCAALLVLLEAARVGATPLTAALEVQREAGADDCPDAAALEATIARILSAPADAASSGSPPAVRARVAFKRSGAGRQATVNLDGAKAGERTLTDTGPTCEALGRAVGITLALVLDTREELATPPAPPVATVAVAAATAPSPSQPATSGVLSVTGGSAFGVVGAPSLTSGIELDVGVGRWLRVQASGHYVAERSTDFDTGAVDVGLLAARLGICGALNAPAAPVRVGLCARGVGGRLRGSGAGFPAANESHALTFWAVGGGLQVSAPVTRRLVLGAQADVLAPLGTYTFSVGNRGVAYESDAVAAMLQLTAGVQLW